MLRPMSDLVVLKPLADLRTTPRGLVFPLTYLPPVHTGEVVAVGPGVRTRGGRRSPVSVAVGQRVVYSKWVGESFSLDGGLVGLHDTDIMGILEET